MKKFPEERFEKLSEMFQFHQEMTIEELKEYAGLLRQENAYLKGSVDKNPAGLATVVFDDGESEMTHCNDAGRYVLGITSGHYQVSELLEFIHPEQREQARKFIKRIPCLEGNKKRTVRFFNQRIRNYIWLSIEANFIHKDTGAIEVYIVMHDITRKRNMDARIRFSKERYEQVIDLAHLCYWDYDLKKKRVVNANESFFGIDEFGFMEHGEPEQIVNQGIVCENSIADFLALYNDLYSGKKEVSGRFWCYKEGWPRQRCFNVQYLVEFDTDGAPNIAHGVGNEVTDQMEAIEIYRNHLNSLVKLNPNTIASFRLNLTENWCGMGVSRYPVFMQLQKSGTTDGFFKAALEMVEGEEQKAEFESIFNRDYLITSYQQGQPRVMYEFKSCYETSSSRWYRMWIEMIQNPINHALEAVVYCSDIEHEKAVTRLMNTTVENDYEAVAIVKRENRNCYYYSKIDNSHGVFKSDFMDLFYYYAVNYEQRDLENVKEMFSWEKILRIVDEEGSMSVTYSIKENGEMKNVRHATFRTIEDNPDILLFTVRDITESWLAEREKQEMLRKALEAEKRASLARNSFLSNVSHDMRTPLNSILGFLPMVKETDDPKERIRLLENIEDSSEYLLGLVNDTLNLHKLETGNMTLMKRSVKASDVLKKLMATLAADLRRKEIELHFPKIGELNKWLMMDPVRVQEIFVNIMSNAIKFVPQKGRIDCEIKEITHTQDDITVEISVADNGIGMTEAFMKTIFDPFTQENPHETNNTSGSGIGMAITKKLVDLMDGEIFVESKVGVGSKFTVRLTFEYAQPVEEQEDEEEGLIDLKGKHILVVEDHPLNIEVLKHLLEKEHLDLVIAHNGLEAVNAYKESQEGFYDAVIMDLMMPVMDGYCATKEIRGLQRSDADVPIIAMTANVNEEDKERTRQAGMNAHLGKPIEPKEMYAVLSKEIRSYREGIS
ncbi:hybrid sensor histidine kinase/response regulator [Eubacterium oxidoreducens]|uniref:Stage 0 sporulation protein A homolog n=1 Tax=Eubacterium oxidoreducens TaxID=1732 RepID=A0A1G6ABK7_EUBOX|nr:PAS domain-containing sensor histidine kinase [Eubacterium oxidoreducens]SDB05680.1 Signal transduction histidine kinase [Eubacterium oxidoreducens]